MSRFNCLISLRACHIAFYIPVRVVAGVLLLITWTSASGTEKQDTIIVTATKTAQIADETLAPVIVINRDEIEASSAKDVGDLLRLHVGLELGRNGGSGQLSSLFVRGTNSNHIIVMIDGVKMNPGTVQSPAFYNISPNLVERIEVVKGPRSALYGSEGIGGVINIITRREDRQESGEVSLGAGTDNTNVLSLNYHFKNGYARSGFVFSQIQTDGFPTRSFPISSELDAHKNNSFNGYFGIQKDKIDIEISQWYTKGNTEYVGSPFSGYPNLDQDFNNYVSAITAKYTPNSNWSNTTKISKTKDSLEQNQSTDHAFTEREALEYQVDYFSSNDMTSTIGIYAANETLLSQVFGTPNNDNPQSRAIFYQYDRTVQNHHFIIAARHSDIEGNKNANTFNVDYSFSYNKSKFLAGFGTGYRAPSLIDRVYSDTTTSLLPEESKSVELGVHHFLNRGNKLALTIYENRIDQLLLFNNDTYFVENIGKTRIRGIELIHTYKHNNWGSRIEASAKDPRNLDDNTQLLRRAKRTLALNINHTQPTLVWNADWIASSERTDFGGVTLGGYAILNTSIKQQLTKNLSFTSKIENLLDKDYELAQGYNTQGRFFMLELKYSK